MTTARPPRNPRPGRPAVLSRERVVAAAVRLVDAEGAQALTMRRLGAELGVAAMSLYRHVPNRDALLTAVVDEHFRAVTDDVELGSTWPESLDRFARTYRARLLAHPRVVPLLASHPVDRETGAGGLAPLVDQCGAAGVEPGFAYLAVQSVAVYVLGHALAQVGTPPGDEAGAESAAERGAAAGDGAAQWFDTWFDVGLAAMVTGFEATVAQGAGARRAVGAETSPPTPQV